MRIFFCILALAAGALLSTGCARRISDFSSVTDPNQFFGYEDLQRFPSSVRGRERTVALPPVEARVFDELVASWNVECPLGCQVKVEARCFANNTATPFYTLGLWSADGKVFPRESVNGQEDADGKVLTDTLKLSHPVNGFQLRVTAIAADTGEEPLIKYLSASLHYSRIQAPAPGRWTGNEKILRVPARSQLGYKNADGWCSPASVSMVLAYWAEKLKRPELDVSVPDVAQSVYDPNWPGTGNWPFNTAFAGSFRGMRAYVTRFNSLDEVAPWITAGVPVILSVDRPLLEGDKTSAPSGHIIVVTGFTADGRVKVNDPWPNPQGENTLQKTFPRQQVEEAWAHSKRAVYLIYPENQEKPPALQHHWEEAQ